MQQQVEKMNLDGVNLADISVDVPPASGKSSTVLESTSVEKLTKKDKEGDSDEEEEQGTAVIPKPPPLPPILGELGPGEFLLLFH